MSRRFTLLVSAVALLSACQSTTQEPHFWVRTDGQRGSGNPALQEQYQIDTTICVGEVQRVAAGASPVYYNSWAGMINAAVIVNQKERALLDVMKGCMAERGYVLVPAGQAEAVSASFRRPS